MAKLFCIQDSNDDIYQFIIDDEDVERILEYKWFYHHRSGYATTNPEIKNGQIVRKAMYLHRFIAGVPFDTDIQVDHINRDKLDCQKHNLRICNRTQNCANKEIPITNTSGYKGVSLNKTKTKWRSYIKVNQKQIHLGEYFTAEEAAKVYDKAAKKHFGEFAVLNFPEKQNAN